MCISQSDGTGRGFSAHPYPKATKDGDYELVDLGGGQFATRKRGTSQYVRVTGNKVRILPEGKER